MVPGLLGLADLDQLVEVERPELAGRALDPGDAFALRGDGWQAMISTPRSGGRHPRPPPVPPVRLESFEGFVESAAKDRDVVAIKTTVYRTDEDSPSSR